MPLNDVAVRNLKEPGKHSDERGLFLLVTPAGGKWWRFRYRFEGKEKLLSLGTYPDVSLKEARQKREEARKMLGQGIDPGLQRKAEKQTQSGSAANAFETLAREWFEKSKATWAPSHADKIIRRLERDVFPWLGSKPIEQISATDILDVLRKIEARGRIETAHRARGNCSQVFRYAIATGRAQRDPVPDLRGALPASNGTHFAAIIDPIAVGGLLRSFEAFKGGLIVKTALQLAPYVFVRPGELRQARWADIESDAAINAALRRMGYDTKAEMTGHGFRAMARTLLAEELHQKPEVIEHQLAHKVPDALGTAYNRTKFLKERKGMMQLWADYLDRLKVGAVVVQFSQGGVR